MRLLAASEAQSMSLNRRPLWIARYQPLPSGVSCSPSSAVKEDSPRKAERFPSRSTVSEYMTVSPNLVSTPRSSTAFRDFVSKYAIGVHCV